VMGRTYAILTAPPGSATILVFEKKRRQRGAILDAILISANPKSLT
jgi:hypothetical protein